MGISSLRKELYANYVMILLSEPWNGVCGSVATLGSESEVKETKKGVCGTWVIFAKVTSLQWQTRSLQTWHHAIMTASKGHIQNNYPTETLCTCDNGIFVHLRLAMSKITKTLNSQKHVWSILINVVTSVLAKVKVFLCNLNERHSVVFLLVQKLNRCPNTTKFYLLHRTTCFELFQVIIRFTVGPIVNLRMTWNRSHHVVLYNKLNLVVFGQILI
jgi:hypothetical protein